MEKQSNKCVIFTSLIENFNINEKFTSIIKEECEESYVVCADGGYAYAKQLNIIPDLIIGDFDSYFGELPESDKNIEIIKVNAIKDDTDTGLCLKQMMSKGFTDITIIGGIGGRLSHTIANLQSMVACAQKGNVIKLKDPNHTIRVLAGEGNITIGNTAKTDEKRNYISIFAHTEECKGVTLKGVFYPLEDAVLTNTFPLGVSNEIVDDEAFIGVKEGILIIIEE